MFKDKFCKAMAVGSSTFFTVVSLMSFAPSFNVSASENSNWFLVFLYYLFGLKLNNTSQVLADVSNKESVKNDSKSESAFVGVKEGKAKQRLDKRIGEAKEEFSSVEKILENLYSQKRELEKEIVSENAAGKATRSEYIKVCEEIGKIKGRMKFCRQCARGLTGGQGKFSVEACRQSLNLGYGRRVELESKMFDEGVDYSEEYVKDVGSCLIVCSSDIEDCSLKLNAVGSKIKTFSEKEVDDMLSEMGRLQNDKEGDVIANAKKVKEYENELLSTAVDMLQMAKMGKAYLQNSFS